MKTKKLQASFQETVDFVVTFQNNNIRVTSVSNPEKQYPVREEYYAPYDDYSEGLVLFGISL